MRKKAIVTGGSRGIGKEIVLELLRNNFEVWYLSRTAGLSEKELCEIAQAPQNSVHHIACDMSDTGNIEKALDTILEQTERVDVLINNAGITRDGLIMRMTDEAWDAVMQVNLKASFVTARKISRIMAKQRSGSIVNISSVVGIMGNGGQTNYAASKAGLIGFSKSLARELASRSVNVNVVAPGFIDTDMTSVLPESIKENIEKQIPLGRLGSANEVAKTVLFLCQQDSSYITGQVIAVDGGMAM
jgi:3-oxoacyl-[acyl-carrier protein] reductase